MRYIVGIDEVGRGCLAGPVVVAALSMPRAVRISNRALGKLKDSKKLTKQKREEWYAYLKAHPRLRYAVTRVYPRGIERMNISRAANLAALRAFKRLVSGQMSNARCQIYLDGGLYLGNRSEKARTSTRRSANQLRKVSQASSQYFASTVIKGDEKLAVIKAASIIAKVSRDRLMTRLAVKYPRYGFDIHKGYGTKLHRKAIKKYGPSPAHRLTFIRFS